MAKNRKLGHSENPVLVFIEAARRAFSEFLFIPTCLIIGFLLLAVATYSLDISGMSDPGPVRKFLQSHIFANSEATAALLAAIAAGVITMTSITISLLLIAVQQSASSMTGQVYDQFLRRRSNQIHFGFFIGLALYSLITLATVNDPFNPVFGATIAFLATVVSLYMLIVLLYATINQMRPVEIVEAIHEHILAARLKQKEFILTTRREPLSRGSFVVPVRTEKHGFITSVDADKILRAAGENAELTLLVPIGTFVAFHDLIAEARAETPIDAQRLADAVPDAVKIERQRDITIDTAFGIEQLEMIGWTSISTAKSNPAPGIHVIHCLRDVMARWSEENDEETAARKAPIVYADDVFERLLGTFESLAVVSSESMQHQICIEVLRTFTVMWDRLSTDRQDRAADLLLRILSALGDFVLTAELDSELSQTAAKLRTSGRVQVAEAISEAQVALSASIGKLNSRSTRTPGS